MSETFGSALAPHYEDAVRYCRALCARWSPSEAEDVLQDALLRALARHGELRDPERFRAWLFTIITRTFHETLRRPWWKRVVLLEPESTLPDMPAVYDPSGHTEDRLTLMKALRSLSDEERELVLLFELGGFSVHELMSMRGYRTASAVKSRLQRARRKLRLQLETEDGTTAASSASVREPSGGVTTGEGIDDIRP